MAQAELVYLGIKGCVIALNSASGQQVWSQRLKGMDFVNVAFDGRNVFAATHGEIFCLDPETGFVRWNNPLKGYGWGMVTMAGKGIAENGQAVLAQKRRCNEQSSAAAASSTSA
jgi:outer membrane protein assembly factor BamB